jgi:hypothetical protein
MYNMSLSNLGGVGVQIVRIYINSTGSGCTFLCVLNPALAPTASSYTFNQASQFINAGETRHAVLLYLKNVVLPNPIPPVPENTILIVTSRGNVFSFNWPLKALMGGQSQSAFSAGIMKIAYQVSQNKIKYGLAGGYDSSNEPGLGGAGTAAQGYCHQEDAQLYQANSTYAEELTGISGLTTGTSLWFVQPWVTQQIFNSAITNSPPVNGHPNDTTTLYIYVNITNVGSTPFAIDGGSVELAWSGFNWLSASLIGYYEGVPPGTFYAAGSTHAVAAGHSFYGIFQVTSLCLGRTSCTDTSSQGTWPPPGSQSVMFLGSASLTSNTSNSTFIAGVALTSGLWIRYSCS